MSNSSKVYKEHYAVLQTALHSLFKGYKDRIDSRIAERLINLSCYLLTGLKKFMSIVWLNKYINRRFNK